MPLTLTDLGTQSYGPYTNNVGAVAGPFPPSPITNTKTFVLGQALPAGTLLVVETAAGFAPSVGAGTVALVGGAWATLAYGAYYGVLSSAASATDTIGLTATEARSYTFLPPYSGGSSVSYSYTVQVLAAQGWAAKAPTLDSYAGGGSYENASDTLNASVNQVGAGTSTATIAADSFLTGYSAPPAEEVITFASLVWEEQAAPGQVFVPSFGYTEPPEPTAPSFPKLSISGDFDTYGQASYSYTEDNLSFPGDHITKVRKRGELQTKRYASAGPVSTPAWSDSTVNTDNTGSPSNTVLITIAWASYLFTPDPAPGPMSAALGPTGRKLRARISSGQLVVDRYDDDFPPAIEETVEVTASPVSRCCLLWWSNSGSVRPDLSFVMGDYVVGQRSLDSGRTWPVSELIATGYQDILTAIPRGRDIKVALLYDEAAEEWLCSVGKLNDDGDAFEDWTTPVSVVTGALPGGTLLLSGAGLEFDHSLSAGGEQTLRNRGISHSDPGVWA